MWALLPDRTTALCLWFDQAAQVEEAFAFDLRDDGIA